MCQSGRLAYMPTSTNNAFPSNYRSEESGLSVAAKGSLMNDTARGLTEFPAGDAQALPSGSVSYGAFANAVKARVPSHSREFCGPAIPLINAA
jgi:hypothetical protein